MTDLNLIQQDAPQTLWEDESSGLRLTAARAPSAAFTQLIEEARFGGAGMRYRRLGVEKLLNRGPDTVFVALNKGDDLIGTYVFDPVQLECGGQRIDGVYRSLLCVAHRAQGQGYGRLIARQSVAWLGQRADELSRPVMSFGCIESNNTRSREVLGSIGGRELGHLHTQMVYRQWPRKRAGVVTLDARTDGRVLAAQKDACGDCGLIYSEYQARPFYAVMEGSQIVAGAHAALVQIDFDRIGQPWDFLSKHVFARVRPARRRFDPRNFTYLKFDGVVAQPGSGPAWRELIGTLLAEHGTHMAMFALDPGSQVSERLHRSGIFGRVAKATRQQLVVVGTTHGSGVDNFDSAGNRPLGVGPLGQ